ELQEVLVLAVAALDGEREVGLAVLGRQGRGQGGARMLARLDDVERVLGGVEHEALHALGQADAGLAGDHGRDPAAAGRDRDDPALVVGGLDRGGAGVELAKELVVRGLAGGLGGGNRSRGPHRGDAGTCAGRGAGRAAAGGGRAGGGGAGGAGGAPV